MDILWFILLSNIFVRILVEQAVPDSSVCKPIQTAWHLLKEFKFSDSSLLFHNVSHFVGFILWSHADNRNISPEIHTSEEPNSMHCHTKRLCNHQGIRVDQFSPTSLSTKGIILLICQYLLLLSSPYEMFLKMLYQFLNSFFSFSAPNEQTMERENGSWNLQKRAKRMSWQGFSFVC